jgi:chromosome segregation ATPase
MEVEQILKHVDWLDDERRKDKNVVAGLQERMIALEGNLPPITQQIKDLSGEISRLSAMLSRMDHFDEALLQQRIESKQVIEELERSAKDREEKAEKVRRVEMRSVESSLAELRKELNPIPELKRGIQARADEESRLARMIDEVRLRIETVRRSEEEYTRSYKLLEDGRRQDSKRLTDVQGETAALRKHVDDQRGRMELVSDQSAQARSAIE